MAVSRTERRANLLDAAQRAGDKHGADVQLNQVAREAGLHSGAVLYHFPDVQTLLVEANRAGMERFYDERLRRIEGVTEPDRKLVLTIESGLPVDSDDPAVKLLCELGGAAGRYPTYAVLLTALYDRQVAMYQVILESESHNALHSHLALATSPQHRGAGGLLRLSMWPATPAWTPTRPPKLNLDYARVATVTRCPAARATKGHNEPQPMTIMFFRVRLRTHQPCNGDAPNSRARNTIVIAPNPLCRQDLPFGFIESSSTSPSDRLVPRTPTPAISGPTSSPRPPHSPSRPTTSSSRSSSRPSRR
jgi:AcrR family transcriptional regulator